MFSNAARLWSRTSGTVQHQHGYNLDTARWGSWLAGAVLPIPRTRQPSTKEPSDKWKERCSNKVAQRQSLNHPAKPWTYRHRQLARFTNQARRGEPRRIWRIVAVHRASWSPAAGRSTTQTPSPADRHWSSIDALFHPCARWSRRGRQRGTAPSSSNLVGSRSESGRQNSALRCGLEVHRLARLVPVDAPSTTPG